MSQWARFWVRSPFAPTLSTKRPRIQLNPRRSQNSTRRESFWVDLKFVVVGNYAPVVRVQGASSRQKPGIHAMPPRPNRRATISTSKGVSIPSTSARIGSSGACMWT